MWKDWILNTCWTKEEKKERERRNLFPDLGFLLSLLPNFPLFPHCVWSQRQTQVPRLHWCSSQLHPFSSLLFEAEVGWWGLCCWVSPHDTGSISVLAGSIFQDSALEIICWGPRRRQPRSPQCLWSQFYINNQDFILISKVPPCFTNTCHMPEVILNSPSLQLACISHKPDSHKMKAQIAGSVCMMMVN